MLTAPEEAQVAPGAGGGTGCSSGVGVGRVGCHGARHSEVSAHPVHRVTDLESWSVQSVEVEPSDQTWYLKLKPQLVEPKVTHSSVR